MINNSAAKNKRKLVDPIKEEQENSVQNNDKNVEVYEASDYEENEGE
jgi:hypothetical protein